MNALFDGLLAALATAGIFGISGLMDTRPLPHQCQKMLEGERLSYSVKYPDGSLKCVYVPDIIGLKRREG